MYPFLLESDANGMHFRLPMYGLMVLSAFVASFALVHHRARRVGLSPERMVPLYGASAVFGLLGAHVLYVVAIEPWKLLTNPAFFFTSGGLAFYGGFLGGAAGVLAVSAWMKLPGWKVVDILAPAVVLGLGIGRMGCFFAGCCHGAEIPDGALGPSPIALLPAVAKGQMWLGTGFPFVALEFHRGGMARILNEPLYPTQLWSAIAGLSISGFLSWMWNHKRFDGQILALMLMTEPIARIFIESFRADERGYAITWAVDHVPAWLPPGFYSAGDALGDPLHPSADWVIGVTTSQFIGLSMILVGIVLYALRFRAGVAPEVPLEEEL